MWLSEMNDTSYVNETIFLLTCMMMTLCMNGFLFFRFWGILGGLFAVETIFFTYDDYIMHEWRFLLQFWGIQGFFLFQILGDSRVFFLLQILGDSRFFFFFGFWGVSGVFFFFGFWGFLGFFFFFQFFGVFRFFFLLQILGDSRGIVRCRNHHDSRHIRHLPLPVSK